MEVEPEHIFGGGGGDLCVCSTASCFAGLRLKAKPQARAEHSRRLKIHPRRLSDNPVFGHLSPCN